ncbi:hypothetical protein V6Z11_D06G139300 [Gossypium hirsutum]
MTSRLIRELLKHSRSGQFLIHVAGVLLEKIQPKVELMLTMGRVELLRLFWVLRLMISGSVLILVWDRGTCFKSIGTACR